MAGLILLFVFMNSEAQVAPSGKFITFNGTDQHMVVADHSDLDIAAGESFTLSLRMYQVNFSAIYRIFGKGNLNISGGRYELYTNNTASSGNLALNLRNANNTNIGSPYVTTLAASRWYHFAWVYNAADHTSKVYLDGTLLNTITHAEIGTRTIENGNDLLVGCGLNNAASPAKFAFWPGQLDELRIWKRALTTDQVNTDKGSTSPDPSNLVAAYDFESLSGDKVPDISGHGHDGTLIGYGVRVVKTALPAGIGNEDERLVCFRIISENRGETLKSLTFNLQGTEDLNDLASINAYYTGGTERFRKEDAVLFGSTTAATGTLRIDGELPLIDGENYVWITADISKQAREGHQVGAQVVSFTKGDGTTVEVASSEGTRTLLLAHVLLFSSGDGGSNSYRIPAIITAPDHSLVTATDKRWNGSADLPNHIDVLARRSTDNGDTWSDPVVIAGEGTTMGYGDPALVVNKKNGEIVCLFASDRGLYNSTPATPLRINISVSKDNGITWSTPREITSQIYGSGCADPTTKNWQAAFVTSGSAAQLSSGRLMAVLAVKETATSGISNYVMYSDDNGENWKVSLNVACTTGDEAKVVELDNGDVLMSIRHSGNRLFNISRDQGITWGAPFSQSGIMDPFCNGDMIRYTSVSKGFDKNRLLHSIPFATSRKNVSVLLSYDEGETWPVRKTIYSGPSAYSALNILKDGTIGMYYEVGEYEAYQMYFVRFSLDWLSSGEDTYIDPFSSARQSSLDSGSFRIFPNPTRETIQIEGYLQGGDVICLSDLSGRVIKQWCTAIPQTHIELSVPGIEPGIYLMSAGKKSLRIVLQ